MPGEYGETRREKVEKAREDDRGGDSLEWCLREHEATMNKPEEPPTRKSSEEPMALVDGIGVTKADIGEAKKPDEEKTMQLIDWWGEKQPEARRDEAKGTNIEEPTPRKSSEETVVFLDIQGIGRRLTKAEREAAIEEAKSPKPEEPIFLTFHAGQTGAEESQKATNKPETSPDSTEAHKIEKEKTNASERILSTHKETALSGQVGRDSYREYGLEERETKRDKKAGKESPQTSEQKEDNQEHGKRPDTPATERTLADRGKEIDPSAKQDDKHQEEEKTSLKLGDNPKPFVEANRELLVKEGITLENDGARLGDKTLLRLDEYEGVTIVHENQHYRITTVEQERIGDLELNRYKTRQGEEFLHIPSEKIVIPPYDTPWYALSADTRIYLEKDYKHGLLQAAIAKAGGEAQLRRQLKERETHLCDIYLYRHLREQRESMRLDKLVPILTSLGKTLDEPKSHITAIGNKKAIESPNLPFNLNSTDGARIMAARYSDGTNCAPKGRGPVFDYANNDLECRNRVEGSLREVFGGANVVNREYDTGEVAKVRTSTYIVGQTLERAGAVIGEVIEQNPHVPTFVLEGSREMKREWLIQAFGDEGYVWPQRGKVRIGRAAEVTGILSEDMMKCLEQQKWDDKIVRGHLLCRARALDDLPPDIKEVIGSHPPNLLLEERGMLRIFGINTKMYPRDIYQREGGYGVNWILQTETREDGKRFLREIGFPQERKERELISMLRLKKCG